MKLKRMKLKDQENYTLCLLSGDQWISFRAVLDIVPDDETKERVELEKASDDIIAFLKKREYLEPKLNEIIEVAKKVTTNLLIADDDVIPFRPLMYRDFMLCETHIINSGRGFVKYNMPKVLPFVKVYEGLSAIGAFCVFNDFSARNVQLEEMKKTGFGPCKSKDFASAISNVVVTADEILPVIDSLKTRVIINDKIVAEGQLNGFYHSLGKAVAYASKGEHVYAGEFMGTGTIPNCCGMENDILLECGDIIRLEIDKIGSLTNPISIKEV